jgi:hypothetical protein
MKNLNNPKLDAEANAIRELKERASLRAKQVVADVVEIGRRLSHAKKLVGHGHWLSWLSENFEWSGDTAERYMRAHELVAKFRTLRNLDLSVIHALAGKNVPEEYVKQVAVRVEAGEKPSVRSVKLEVTHERREVKAVSYPVSSSAPTVYEPPDRPEWPLELDRFLEWLARIADVNLPTAREVADAVRAGQTRDLSSGYLREIAAMLLAVASELDGDMAQMPRLAVSAEGTPVACSTDEVTPPELAPIPKDDPWKDLDIPPRFDRRPKSVH